jgi:hypothetical protein
MRIKFKLLVLYFESFDLPVICYIENHFRRKLQADPIDY